MKESYTSSVALNAGHVFTKHGTVDSMNLLDGYGLSEISDVGQIGKLRASPDGTLWAWTGRQLSRYRNARWESFDVDRVTHEGILRSDPEQHWTFMSNRAPYLRSRIWVVGIDADRALILLPDQILQFDARTKSNSVVLASRDTNLGSFTSMRRESTGNIWITGQRGLGTLSDPLWKWRESASPLAGMGTSRSHLKEKTGRYLSGPLADRQDL
jgi:hypothetical protein